MNHEDYKNLVIDEEYNPYRECIQGAANEPICVLHTVQKAWDYLAAIDPSLEPQDLSLKEIVERLVANKPRIAVITGSIDHPAHLRDDMHISLAVLRIWHNGGVPFVFGIPVICDGTAQSNIGQSYSLVSRNDTAAATNITFEGHSYHAAYVLSSCDKFPSAVLSGLAATDLARSHKDRKQAPVWAIFVPSHVLKGGTIPAETARRLNQLADSATQAGDQDLADDIRENMRYILQCSSDEAFAGQLRRAVLRDILSAEEERQLLNQLAAATCDKKGGVCAFNGTGNSSRTLICALGLAPPNTELLVDAPSAQLVADAVDMLYSNLNKPEQRVINIIGRNYKNAVRIHNTTGSSSNIMLHLPALMRYAGYDITLADYAAVRKETPVPETFAHSLTENRDTFTLAQQFIKGQHQAMNSIYRVLSDLGIAMDMDAPTMSGQTWRERIKDINIPVDPTLGDQAIIRTSPVRDTSGVEVLHGNFMSSAIVKVAGMSDKQLTRFEDQLLVVRYYENEHICINDISSPDLVTLLTEALAKIPQSLLDQLVKHNSRGKITVFDATKVYDLVNQGALSFAFIIAGQGPRAFGMPEMFAPSQNLKHHKFLEPSSLLITDGRYSGVTKGACIGHVTPEAYEGGGIGRLQDGDILHFCLDEHRLDMVDREALLQGEIISLEQPPEREELVKMRYSRLQDRRMQIAASNLMEHVTDAEHGVVPDAVNQRATRPLPQ